MRDQLAVIIPQTVNAAAEFRKERMLNEHDRWTLGLRGSKMDAEG